MTYRRQKNGYFLLPNYCKKIGWSILFLVISPLIIAPFAWAARISAKQIFGWIPFDKFNDLLSLIGLCGLFIVILSKEPKEDERIMQARYKALGNAFITVITSAFLGNYLTL